MKLIPLRTGEKFKSKDVLKLVAEADPSGIKSLDEHRKRNRILDALEECDGANLLLEDADWQLLKDAIARFPFTMTSKELLAVIDDVENAKKPPAVMLVKTAEKDETDPLLPGMGEPAKANGAAATA